MAFDKFIAYYRVSTAKQGASGLGLEAQQSDVKAYLNRVRGELVGEFQEIESGTRKGNGKRPKLAAALAECKVHKATLLIAKLDRLYRNVAAQSALMESGVEFIAIDNATASRFTLHIMAAVAEDEAVKISQRIKAALKVRKLKGLPMGSQCWESGNGKLSLENQIKGRALAAQSNKEKADEAASMICAKIAEIKGQRGELSHHEVAQELNLRGITTGKGKRWAYSSVRNALERMK